MPEANDTITPDEPGKDNEEDESVVPDSHMSKGADRDNDDS